MTVDILVGASSHIVRQGLVHLVESAPGLSVIDVCDSERRLVELAETTAPSVVLSAFDPIERSTLVAQSLPEVPVVAVVWQMTDDDLVSALTAGVRGVINKDADVDQLVEVVEAVGRGLVVYPAAWEQRLAQWLRARAETALGPPTLTMRERQVLQLLVDGERVAQIADRLGIATQTARNHLHHVMTKIGVTSRLELYAWAREHGFSPRDSVVQ